MMYPYMTLADETEIVHSHLIDGGKVIVHFERPTESGFDSARFELPTYELIFCEGYSQGEMASFKRLLRHNSQELLAAGRNKLYC